MDSSKHARRPLAVRGAGWVKKTASILTRSGIAPNTISLMSMVFAALGALLLCFSPDMGYSARAMAYVGAALMIQLRLLCNLFDGMVAVEGQRFTKSGELFNEVPDRVSDTLLIVALGYALPSLEWAIGVAWLAALLAMMTAYVRIVRTQSRVSRPDGQTAAHGGDDRCIAALGSVAQWRGVAFERRIAGDCIGQRVDSRAALA